MDEVIIPVCNQVSDYVLGQGFWVRSQHILVLAVCAFLGVLSIAIRLLEKAIYTYIEKFPAGLMHCMHMWFKSHAMFVCHIFDSTTSKVSGPVTENSQLSQLSQLLLKPLGSQVNACSCGSQKNTLDISAQ